MARIVRELVFFHHVGFRKETTVPSEAWWQVLYQLSHFSSPTCSHGGSQLLTLQLGAEAELLQVQDQPELD